MKLTVTTAFFVLTTIAANAQEAEIANNTIYFGNDAKGINSVKGKITGKLACGKCEGTGKIWSGTESYSASTG